MPKKQMFKKKTLKIPNKIGDWDLVDCNDTSISYEFCGSPYQADHNIIGADCIREVWKPYRIDRDDTPNASDPTWNQLMKAKRYGKERFKTFEEAAKDVMDTAYWSEG